MANTSDQCNVIVVEDFYDNPEEVRGVALAAQYRSTKLTGTDALVSRERHPKTISILERIAGMVACRPDIAKIEAIRSFWGFAACGEFQLRTESLGQGRIHCHLNGEWVGIVYLTLDIHCNGRPGTIFYRHRSTGLARYSASTEVEYSVFQDAGRTPDAWSHIRSVPMAFNRLVLFDSRYFHAESAGFGTGPNDGRLIQIFNFTSL